MSVARDAWADVEPRPKPARDRYGRYLIPDPETGEIISWTRVSTIANALADTFALTRWQVRMTALGLAQRPDLLARVASTHPEQRSDLDELCEAAKEHAGTTTGANLGTALHSFTEAHDLGQHPNVPEPYRADVDAYASTMRDANIDVVDVEQIVIVRGLAEPIAGMFDRTLRRNELLKLGDLKTGKTLDYSWCEIAIQLALYAHADAIWDAATQLFRPMPNVDRDVAIVMHLPVGQGRCDLYEVDIAAGWSMVQTCTDVRVWRKRKDLAQLVQQGSSRRLASSPAAGGGVVPPTSAPSAASSTQQQSDADCETRRAWLRERILALSSTGSSVLVAGWPANTPRLSEALPAQFDAISAAISNAEASTRAPFAETSDPGYVHATDPRRRSLLDRLDALPSDLDQGDARVQLKARMGISLDDWHALEVSVDRAESVHKGRCVELIDLLATTSHSELILAALNLNGNLSACAWHVESVRELIAALDSGLLVERGGRLCVERPLTVLDGYRRRSHLVEIAKELAVARHRNVPRSSTQALEDVVLVAALAAALVDEHGGQQTPQGAHP